ncbi:MAG: NTP transferase domain-containing protein [Phycisphaerales bacterium]|nr:NTP transferase domain-containing protein [Phycisphaerales bacterium]
MAQPRIGAVVLAAGKGTRLKSELPKVLHEVCGRPMLAFVLDACRAAGVEEAVAVVGHGQELVRAAFAHDAGLHWVEQSPQRGTGHAVMVCREEMARFEHVLVLCGDGPLIRSATLSELLERHLAEGNAATLATAVLDDPAGYGRIWRDGEGRFLGIVEQLDCTPEQRAIREVNPSYYCFRVADLLIALDQLQPNNAKNEYYITDTFALFRAAGRPVGAVTSVPPADIYSINSRHDLAMVNAVMRDRILRRLMDEGVTIVDPATTWIDARAQLGRDTVVYPFVALTGPVQIGANCRIGPFVHLAGGTSIGDGTVLSGALSGGA